jgi:hypothetical protein
MKIKLLTAVGIVVLLISFIIGTTGAFQLADQAGGGDAVGDRVAGVFITREYLEFSDDEMLAYIQEHAEELFSGKGSDLDMSSLDSRIYAKRVEGSSEDPTPSFEFEGIKGVFLCSIPATEENGNTFMASMIGNTEAEKKSKRYTSIQSHISYGSSDDGTSVTIEATVYVLEVENVMPTNPIPVEDAGNGLESVRVMSESEENFYYVYTVFQSVSGDIYLKQGEFTPVHPSIYNYGSGSISIAWEAALTQNGKKTTDSLKVNITFESVRTPEKYVIIEADPEHGIVKREEFVPGTLPETIGPQDITEYIIVETYTMDSSGNPLIERKIYQATDENHLVTTYCVEDETLYSMVTEIEWEKENE